VESVTVVELSADVIKLFKTHILPKMENGHKIRIVNADAFEYAEKVMPSENFDLAFVDTWRDASDGAPMYERMRALEKYSKNAKFLYWIENFIRSRLRALKFAQLIDKESISYAELADEIKKI
jgi:spermidine synthase